MGHPHRRRPVRWDVQDDYAAAGAGRIDPATAHPDRAGDLGDAVRTSGLFEEPVIRRYPFDVTFTADDYALNPLDPAA